MTGDSISSPSVFDIQLLSNSGRGTKPERSGQKARKTHTVNLKTESQKHDKGG